MSEKEVRNPLSMQMDELERISREERNKRLGEQWETEAEKFYNLTNGEPSGPSFRPRVSIPQLQVLCLNEATDLTDNNPRILITQRETGGRDKQREEAFMAHWRQQFWSNELLIAQIWAMFTGIAYLEVGYDSFANRGQGEVWVRMCDPRTVFPDPFCRKDKDCQWVLFKKKMFLDQVRMKWPEQGWNIKRTVGKGLPQESEASHQFQMPPGPMAMVPGLPGAPSQTPDAQVEVRWLYCRDYTIIENKDSSIPGRFRYKYPNGRLIIECDGIVLFDGENPMPFGMFPHVSLTAFPRLNSYYPPSARSYSSGLQELAEKFLAQIYENAVRTNNAMILIDQQSGINTDDVGGVPGEIISHEGRVPDPIKVVNPATAVLQPQIMEMPKQLLELQKFIQGFTPARLGEPTQGNVAKDLYGMSIYESQKLTRMRGRLMAESVQRVCELALFTMMKFYIVNRRFPVFADDAADKLLADWNPLSIDDAAKLDVAVDPASIRPVSQTAMKSLALPLAQAGALDTQELLEAVEWPAAAEVAKRAANQAALAAIASLTQKGKK